MRINRNFMSKDWWRQPLVMALCVSLMLHALFYGTWRVGHALGWWKTSMPFLSQLLNRLNSMLVDSKKIEEALERQQQLAAREVPLTFVDVLPEQATTEAPEKADFYGALNSRAASKEASETDSNLPKIDGEQDKVVKAVDVPRNNPAPAVQPQAPRTAVAEQEQPPVDADKLQPVTESDLKAAGRPEVPDRKVADTEVTKPGSPDQLRAPAPVSPKPGDLTRASIHTQPDKGDGAVRKGEDGEVPRPRPRTIAQARAQLPQNNSIAGQKMKLEGSSRLQRVWPSFNTEGTQWGSYDAKFVAIITSQWYHFLDQHPEAFNWAGRVVVKFQLNYDGRITDFEVIENTSGELQGFGALKAINEGAPYDPWPPSLRRITEKDYRELRFTFYYN